MITEAFDFEVAQVGNSMMDKLAFPNNKLTGQKTGNGDGHSCQTRGPKRNELIMKELQFDSTSWIHEAIQKMLDATKTMRAPVVRTREQQEQEELNEEIEDTDGTEQDEVENVPMTAELMDYKSEMNANEVLRILSTKTRDYVGYYGIRTPTFAKHMFLSLWRTIHIEDVSLRIHQNERHGDVSEELDAVDRHMR